MLLFTTTETVGTIRDREPRMSPSTFTQLLSFDSSPFFFSIALHPQTVGTVRDGGSQDVHLDFHTAPEL